MAEEDIDLLAIQRGTVTAPAGCGKTHLIAEALSRHDGAKPILILTHTNAGVAALRGRLNKAGVPARAYRLATIDGWIMRLVGLFPERSEADPNVLRLGTTRPNYPAVRKAAWTLLKAGHVQDILSATYSRLIVDEYQDCSLPQHAIVYYVAPALPTCVLGDPMQAIFGWEGNEPPSWDEQVCSHFPIVGELSTPWRWRNAGTEAFGRWLLDVRRMLIEGQAVDLANSPEEVSWVHLDGTEDRARQLRAGRTRPPDPDGNVLVIALSTSPQTQQEFASQIPGAVTVEAVDLRDLVEFARDLDFSEHDALEKIIRFASSVMTNVGAADLIRRLGVLERGTGRNPPTDVERAAFRFQEEQSSIAAIDLLAEIGKEGGTRQYRPAVLRACIKALHASDGTVGNTFYDCAIQAREQNRLIGRSLPKRAVGSTLLVKGLEADVSVILDARDHDTRHLYVAMTRGAKRLVVCSNDPVLHG